MREHRIHLVPRHEAFAARRCAGCGSPFHRDEEGHDHSDPESLSAVHRPTVTRFLRAAIVKTCSIDRSNARKVHRWRDAKCSLKSAREVWLIMEAAFHGNLRKRHLPGLHQTGGSLKAKPQHELVR